MGTKIEWAEDTVNPVVGCDKISPGCKGCYAEVMAKRLVGMGQEKYFGVVDSQGWTGQTNVVLSAMDKCFKNKKPTVYFVSSMGDLFHKTVSFKDLHVLFSIIANLSHHTFLVLTKRAETMAQYFRAVYPEYEPGSAPIPNLWIGVTAENQEMADERIPILLQIPAAKRFVSIEPMLGPVKFPKVPLMRSTKLDIITQRTSLDWVICGGESGPGARPMHPDWARSLRDQCQKAGVPFMFKQFGEWCPWDQLPDKDTHPADQKGKHDWVNVIDGKNTHEGPGMMTIRIGKKKAGRELDGKIWNQKPES